MIGNKWNVALLRKYMIHPRVYTYNMVERQWEDENIVWFQVSVDDLVLMQETQTLCNLYMKGEHRNWNKSGDYSDSWHKLSKNTYTANDCFDSNMAADSCVVPSSVYHTATRQWWYCASILMELLHDYSVTWETWTLCKVGCQGIP